MVIGHGALLANLAAIGEHWDLGPTDVGLSWLPLFHDMGLIGTMINALYLGGTLYHWPTASFLRSPGRYLQLVGELDVTMTVAPPFALQLVTRRQQRRPSAVDLSGLRSILVGAELIRPEVLAEFTAAFAPHGLAARRGDAELRARGGDRRGHRDAHDGARTASSTSNRTRPCPADRRCRASRSTAPRPAR